MGIRRPDSFQSFPVTGQGTTDTNWSIGASTWTWGRTSSLWGWWSTGTGYPEGLWILLLWRFSRPAWTRSCAACSRWPWFSRAVGLDDPQRSLPTPNILWCCDHLAPTPLAWAGTPSTRPGCSKAHPTWSWTFLGSGHPQLLWATCSMPHHPHHKKFLPCM